MDQLKPVLQILQKWGFWIICGLAVVIGLGVWFFAYQSVQANIKARKDQIEGLKTQVSGIKPGSPNPEVIEATKKKIEELRSDVYQAWMAMYAAQKEKNRWPAALGQEFLNWVNQPGRKPGDPIPERFREIYLNFIEQHFPTLFEIINLRRPANVDLKQLGSIRAVATSGAYGSTGYESSGYPGAMGMGTISEGAYPGGTGYGGYPGSGGTGTGPTIEMLGIVEWNPQNIAAIKQRFAWRQVPTSDEIWNAQEDLWVYEALLRVIAKTNEGATGPHNAVVKRINAIDIGPDAARYLASATAAASSTMGSMSSPMSGSPSSGEPMSSETGSSSYGSGYPGYPGYPGQSLVGRYVDASGKPLPPGSPQPFAEFKMMPIRLDLVVDQRKIDQLLVNCANSDMPIRITRVLIRPTQSALGASGYGGYGGYSGSTGYGGYSGSSSYGTETGSEMASPYGTSGSMGAGATTVRATASHDVPVVIEGILYIFNPPNIEELGKQGAPELTSGQSLAPVQPLPGAQPTQPGEAAEVQPGGQPAGAGQPGAQPGPAGGAAQPSAPGAGPGQPGGMVQPAPAGAVPGAQPPGSAPGAGQPGGIAQPVPAGRVPAAQPAAQPAGVGQPGAQTIPAGGPGGQMPGPAVGAGGALPAGQPQGAGGMSPAAAAPGPVPAAPAGQAPPGIPAGAPPAGPAPQPSGGVAAPPTPGGAAVNQPQPVPQPQP